jgi:methylamine dehydrogenase heavy chain
MKHLLATALVCAGQSLLVPVAFSQAQASSQTQASAPAPIYDTIIGDSGTLATPTAHWFTVAGREIAYIIDGDAGTVEGTLTLSRFSPALEPHPASQRIFSYGSFYSRNVYGDRTDVVQTFDLNTTLPVTEVEIPPKSAGIGHAGMIGLIEDRFIGVWNITPAMSVSVVDTADQSFIGEISTPGCAGVYPVDAGFLMACGDGKLQYLRLDDAGREVDRVRSEAFFSISEDPVFDYAVETATGWMFLSLEGHVFEATVSSGAIHVSEPWSINPTDIPDAADLNGVPIAADDDWRIGGRQPFAYNAANNLLVTLMH